MKILIVLNNVWPPPIEITGLSSIYTQAKEYSRLGHEVHFLTSVGVWEKNITGSKKSSKEELTKISEWHSKQSEKYNFTFHTYTTGVFSVTPHVSFIANRVFPLFLVPNLNKQYDFDVIHEFTGTPALIYRSWLLKLLTRKKVFHTLIGEVPGFLGTANWLKLFQPRLNGVFLTSKRLYNKFLNLGFHKDTLHFLSLSIDLNKFAVFDSKKDFRKKYNLGVNDSVFLFLAPLDYHKGFDVFGKAAAEAVKLDDRIRIIVATYESGGAVPYKKRKQELLDAIAGNENKIQILEGVHDVPELLSVSDAAVFPQISIDGATSYPITLMEAMAAKVITISSRLEPLQEIIIEGKNGYLFENKNSTDLAKIMKTTVDLKPEKREKILEEAYKLSENLFSVKTTAKKVLGVYKNAQK